MMKKILLLVLMAFALNGCFEYTSSTNQETDSHDVTTTTNNTTQREEGFTLDCSNVVANGGVMSFVFVTKIDKEYVVKYNDEEVSPTIEHDGEFVMVSDEKMLDANPYSEPLEHTVSIGYEDTYFVVVESGSCYQPSFDSNITEQ